MATEPTPPAPFTIKRVLPLRFATGADPGSVRGMRRRSNRDSHAVSTVSGRPAAAAQSALAGLAPTMRLSTSWYCALLP